MSAIDPSIYEYINIESLEKRTIDIKALCASIDYYEDIYSPTLTAKIVVINTGQSIKGPDGKLTSLYTGLPLRGGERVCMKINGNTQKNPGLEFLEEDVDNYLYVSSITNVIKTSMVETFVLNLVSREALTNETSRVGEKYIGLKVEKVVGTLIKEKLLSQKPYDFDDSESTYSFIGNLRKPFHVITWLASKCVPGNSGTGGEDSTAGYCFFETKSGYNFKSIDGLISSEPVGDSYFYSEVPGNDDNKIIKYSIDENQDLIGKLRKGSYCTYRMYFDPLNCTFIQKTFTSDDYLGKARTTGEKPLLPKLAEGDSDRDIGDSPSRITTAVLDRGTFDEKVSTKENDLKPMRTQAQAAMRYNLITTQTLSMMIPSNTSLEAGNIIKCEFPVTTVKEEGTSIDTVVTGLYMIRALCHHFDADGSYTSLELIKDTLGEQEKDG